MMYADNDRFQQRESQGVIDYHQDDEETDPGDPKNSFAKEQSETRTVAQTLWESLFENEDIDTALACAVDSAKSEEVFDEEDDAIVFIKEENSDLTETTCAESSSFSWSKDHRVLGNSSLLNFSKSDMVDEQQESIFFNSSKESERTSEMIQTSDEESGSSLSTNDCEKQTGFASLVYATRTKDEKSYDTRTTFADTGSISSVCHEIKEHVASIKKTKPFVILVASIAALGGLIFGYDMGNTSATFLMPGFQEHVGWCQGDYCTQAERDRINRDQGLINGLFCAGAAIGALISPWITDNFGRRSCMFTTILVTLGSAIQASASTVAFIQGGRMISGLGIGSLSMCSPVYIAELTPEHARGVLSTLFQFGASFGLLLASAANMGLREWISGWRISYGGNILFSVSLLFALLFVPESPRWLVSHGREEEARVALNMTRYAHEIDEEMDKLISECQAEKELGVSSWREVMAVENKMRYRLLIGIGLQCVQQFSGINAIMFYAPTILNKFVGANMAVAGTFILTLTNFLSTFITVYVVDRAGRALLLIVGGIVMILALSVNSLLSSMTASALTGYFVLLFSAIFIIGYAASWGPVVWTLNAEFFPLRERGKANGLTTMSNWICATFVGAVFPIASSASLPACFGFFAIVTYLGVLMVYFFMAETAQKTILQIDAAFENHRPKLFRKEWR